MIDLARLKDPFPALDIEWRVQSSGLKGDKVWARVLAYVTNRAIQDRLDAVCGPENWRNEYAHAPEGGVLCGISIRIGDEWVTKWDGADNTQLEATKGGLSGAMKRAGVQWGIGRYLYRLPEGWAEISESGAHRGKTKEGTWFRWNPPPLPEWALPEVSDEGKAAGARINRPQAQKYIQMISEYLEMKDFQGIREVNNELKESDAMCNFVWDYFSTDQKTAAKALLNNNRPSE